MKKVYSINELVNFAVQIEVQGAEFYKKMATRTKDAEAAKIYNFLSGEELRHREIYQALLEQVDQTVNPGTVYSDEYHQYLNALVENIVFSVKNASVADTLANDLEAVDFAIGKEKDSILFYTEMQKFVPQENQSVIEEIIEEEQLHILKLLDIKEKLN